MKTIDLNFPAVSKRLRLLPLFILFTSFAYSQMPPPGYERALKIEQEKQKLKPFDKDSITLIDTSVVFDPNTYEQEVIITHTRYSIRDYCFQFLGVQDPEFLLDGLPHKILDPNTYEDLIIRWNPAGKIDTIPNK